MNVHSLSNAHSVIAPDFPSLLRGTELCLFRATGPGTARARELRVTVAASTLPREGSIYRVRTRPFSRPRLETDFQIVLRHDRHRTQLPPQTIDRKPGRLRGKLPDGNDRAQDAHGINRDFQEFPAFFFRVNQQFISCVIVHKRLVLSLETPAITAFVCCLLIIDNCFEHWMPRRCELDSNNCHVERCETSLIAHERAYWIR
jgi:hypothetical protein